MARTLYDVDKTTREMRRELVACDPHALETASVPIQPNQGRLRGRPKGALTEAAKNIGINEQRVFEVRQIREADPALYRKVRAGSQSLRGTLKKISSSAETRSYKSDLDNSESISLKRDWNSGNARTKGSGQGRLIARSVDSKVGHRPSGRATEKALVWIKEILGNWFYGEVKGRNLIQKPEEIVQFSKLTDAQMREIGSLLRKGWTFGAAFEEVIERLTPTIKSEHFIHGQLQTVEIGS